MIVLLCFIDTSTASRGLLVIGFFVLMVM